MDEPATPRVGAGHVVLCGLNELGYRTLEELSRMGAEVVVVVVRVADADLAAGARALGASLVQGSYRDEPVLRAAGVPAAALVVTEDDDVGNLHAALTAHDLNPALRIRQRRFAHCLTTDLIAFRDPVVLAMREPPFGCSTRSWAGGSSGCSATARCWTPRRWSRPAFVAAAVHRDAQQAIAGR